jgi:hypothetical protein
MAFVFNVGFATEHDKEVFVERVLPKVRAQQTDPAPADGDGDDELQQVGLAVTSPSAAKEICHQVVAFLAHAKNSRVTLSWTGADGQPQAGDVAAGSAKDAEIVAMRLGTAAKAHIDAEKEGQG